MDPRPRVLVSLAICGLVLAGCGTKMARVCGRVTYDGEPVLRGGLVVFFDAEGGSAVDRAVIQSGGWYSLDGIAPGKKTVTAAAARPYVPPMCGVVVPPWMLEFPDEADGNARKVELAAGPNFVDLELTKPAGYPAPPENLPQNPEELLRKPD